MTLTILLYAAIRDTLGVDRIDVDVPDQSTAQDVLAAVARQHPQIASWIDVCRLAVGDAYVAPHQPIVTEGIAPDLEIAIIPPVSGG